MSARTKRIKSKQWSVISRVCIISSIVALVSVGVYLIKLVVNDEPFINSPIEPASTDFFTNLDNAILPFHGNAFENQPVFKNPMWGSLNSGHYFGLKMPVIDSIETSLVWFDNKLNSHRTLNMRHLCNQEDRLKSYSWSRHDFYNFGQQKLIDDDIEIDTSYIKNPANTANWKARISLSSRKNASSTISIIQYIAINNKLDKLNLVKAVSEKQSLDTVLLEVHGSSVDIGPFSFLIKLDNNTGSLIYSNYVEGVFDITYMTVTDFLHMNLVAKMFDDSLYHVLPGKRGPLKGLKTGSLMDKSNFIAYQMIFKVPSSFSIEFKKTQGFDEEFDFNESIQAQEKNFDAKFNSIFKTQISGFDYNELESMGKTALSNMLGSIGFFHGRSLLKSKTEPNRQVLPYGPIQLLSGVPSRSFFPRGFLWDEGFHNMLISEWDPSISNSILLSWFYIINRNGWIPREVILGPESIRRVPEEFLVQDITNANPPTMFLTVEKMIDSDTLSMNTLKKIYPRLLAWFNWFNVTQAGSRPYTYRWRGRDELSISMLNAKTLTSGLDDYPRASHPSSHEYHVDLRCWMALATRTIVKISRRLNDLSTYESMLFLSEKLHDNIILDKLHWDEDQQMYCDFGHSTNSTKLVWVSKTRTNARGQVERFQTLERRSEGPIKFGCIPEFGYVSLFPLLLEVIDAKNRNLGRMLERLSSDKELWSPCGIRSLSKTSQYYNKYNTEHDKPYWRGPVWININYLLLRSLKRYSEIDGPYKDKCRDIFTKLRTNLIQTVYISFKKSGYLWENYNDDNCDGQGSHPFTGWTSLILLIMSSKL